MIAKTIRLFMDFGNFGVRFRSAVLSPGAWALALFFGLASIHANNSKAEELPADIADLKAIVDAEEMLVRRMQEPVAPERLDKEIAHRIENIKSLYRAYLHTYPRHPFGSILYGKFLRKVNDPHEANEVFLDIHEDNPEIAVVHQHLALYASETGNYADAFQFYQSAIAMEPKAALYRYQFGEFLHTYSMRLIEQNLISHSELEALLVTSFKEASRLAPESRDFKLRWAESYFDVFRPDWDQALLLWDSLIESSVNRFELDVLHLQKSRVLIELKRYGEAKSLILKVNDPALQSDRRKLLALIP
jgi:tetratricopeptide (TPR) repeat protein